MGTRAQEKRAQPRTSQPFCAWLTFPDDYAAYGTTTVDLGPGGAQFDISRPVEPGVTVHISLQLEPGVVQCQAEVLWVRQTGRESHDFGVRFHDLKPETQTHLMQQFYADNAGGNDQSPQYIPG